jgi:hypothetical protein
MLKKEKQHFMTNYRVAVLATQGENNELQPLH